MIMMEDDYQETTTTTITTTATTTTSSSSKEEEEEEEEAGGVGVGTNNHDVAAVSQQQQLKIIRTSLCEEAINRYVTNNNDEDDDEECCVNNDATLFEYVKTHLLLKQQQRRQQQSDDGDGDAALLLRYVLCYDNNQTKKNDDDDSDKNNKQSQSQKRRRLKLFLVLKLLLSYGKIDPNQLLEIIDPDEDSDEDSKPTTILISPLCLAIHKCNTGYVDLLLQYGADPNNDYHHHHHHHHLYNNNNDYYHKGEEENNNNKNENNEKKEEEETQQQQSSSSPTLLLSLQLPLHTAVTQYCNRSKSWNRYAKHFYERQCLLEQIIPSLLQQQQGGKKGKGANPNVVDLKSNNQTPLGMAASNGEDELVELLLLNGANPNYNNNNNNDDYDEASSSIHSKTPLDMAVQNGHVRCTQLLLNHGAAAMLTTSSRGGGSSSEYNISQKADKSINNRTKIVLQALAYSSDDGNAKIEWKNDDDDDDDDEMKIPSNIKKLTLKYYTIDFLPEIFYLSTLEHLILNEVDVMYLPNSICNLCNLQTFSIGYSESPNLISLPPNIGQLTKLHTISLSNCTSLRELPNEIENLINLHTLHIWHCNFTTIPTRLPQSLKVLKLIRCKISSLDYLTTTTTFKLPIRLEVLQLDKNPILYQQQQRRNLISLLQRQNKYLSLQIDDIPYFPLFQQFPLLGNPDPVPILYMSTFNRIVHCNQLIPVSITTKTKTTTQEPVLSPTPTASTSSSSSSLSSSDGEQQQQQQQQNHDDTTTTTNSTIIVPAVPIPLSCWPYAIEKIQQQCQSKLLPVFENQIPIINATLIFDLLRYHIPTFLERN